MRNFVVVLLVAASPLAAQGRSVTDTSRRELEQLPLFARGDTLIYEAHPSSQRMNEFKSTKIAADELVFEGVRQGTSLRLRASSTLAEDIRMDGKLTISNGRPAQP